MKNIKLNKLIKFRDEIIRFMCENMFYFVCIFIFYLLLDSYIIVSKYIYFNAMYNFIIMIAVLICVSVMLIFVGFVLLNEKINSIGNKNNKKQKK